MISFFLTSYFYFLPLLSCWASAAGVSSTEAAAIGSAAAALASPLAPAASKYLNISINQQLAFLR